MERIPPGQFVTERFPILTYGETPRIAKEAWRLEVTGLVETPLVLTYEDLLARPQVELTRDFHCVTRWSRLGNLWEGVSARHLIELAGGPAEGAQFALAHGYDHGFTTNLPLTDLLSEDALVAITHDGEPLSTDHGGPARLVVPLLYAWKSAKWISGLELLPADRAGFWESNGYHMRGDPWTEERHSW